MTEMWFRLHPPFGNRKVGDRKVWEEIALEAPITVKDFLTRLKALHPELCDHICVEEEETFHHLLLFRQGDVIDKNDKVYPDDRIEIMMPLTGG